MIFTYMHIITKLSISKTYYYTFKVLSKLPVEKSAGDRNHERCLTKTAASKENS